jgi:hypothetical protein
MVIKALSKSDFASQSMDEGGTSYNANRTQGARPAGRDPPRRDTVSPNDGSIGCAGCILAAVPASSRPSQRR